MKVENQYHIDEPILSIQSLKGTNGQGDILQKTGAEGLTRTCKKEKAEVVASAFPFG